MQKSPTPKEASSSSATYCSVPAQGIKGFKENWRADVMSGLLVSLIALPLCLGIAMASGFPAFGGIVTAIIGGLVVGPLCGSQLSIKGPAAGMIAISMAAVETLGAGNGFDGYRYALAAIVVASIFQIAFALFRFGRFSDFFPLAVVHGMLAAIGVIIFSKQIHPLLGVKALSHEPIDLLLEIPHSLVVMNPRVAFVGLVSVLIVIGAARLLGRAAKFLPAPLLAVAAGVVFCLYFDIAHPHSYFWYSQEYILDEKFLVNLPSNFLAGVTTPDFSKVFSVSSIQFIVMFALIGSLESMLTVKAVDALDPFRRRALSDRDLMAVGFGNVLSGLVGGLPMISEVVRSHANVSYGAKTRWSNFFHGAFLLFFAVVLVDLIHLIPIAALAGVLCVTGYRLASPRHFKEFREIGIEQLAVFVITIVATLMTDLLVGVFIGIVAQYLACILLGAPLRSLFKTIKSGSVGDDGTFTLKLPEACFFGNVVGFRRQIDSAQGKNIILDFSETVLVDHTFMCQVKEFESVCVCAGLTLQKRNFDRLLPVSGHQQASHRFAQAPDDKPALAQL